MKRATAVLINLLTMASVDDPLHLHVWWPVLANPPGASPPRSRSLWRWRGKTGSRQKEELSEGHLALSEA